MAALTALLLIVSDLGGRWVNRTATALLVAAMVSSLIVALRGRERSVQRFAVIAVGVSGIGLTLLILFR